MEACNPGNKTPCPDIRSISGPSTDLCNSSNSNSEYISSNGCKTYLMECLSLAIEISTTSLDASPGKRDKGGKVRDDDREDLGNIKSDNSASGKCFSNRAAFPESSKPNSSVDGFSNMVKVREGDKASEASSVKFCAKPVDETHSQSLLQPTPRKLMSAIKGSREKQGIVRPKELTVTWAPDVYDPTPTSVSHVPSNKNQRYHSNGKKYGKKNKQKGGGKSSRANKGKDKKQTRKNNGNGSLAKSQPPPLNNDTLVGFDEHQVSDFNIVSPPDPFCGSSLSEEIYHQFALSSH